MRLEEHGRDCWSGELPRHPVRGTMEAPLRGEGLFMLSGGTRDRSGARGRPSRPSRAGWPLARAGWRWLTRLHPLHSWLLVMGVILVLGMIGLRPLALVVAIGWTGYAAFTWLSPAVQARVRRFRSRLRARLRAGRS